MSLETVQSVSLNGTSTINGKQVATFTTNIAPNPSFSSVSVQIIDRDLYAKNKEAFREDRSAFVAKADSIADSLDSNKE